MFASASNSTRIVTKNIHRLTVTLLGVLVILVGCGSGTGGDDEGHQFANDPRPTAKSTEVVAASPVATKFVEAPVPTESPEDVLSVRGAPRFVYLRTEGDLQVYDTSARTFTNVELPDEMTLLDHTSSPTGDRVGVLGVLNDAVVVQFFGADGISLGEPTQLPNVRVPQEASPEASPQATPGRIGIPPSFAISWVPQGNSVVVSGPGVLQRVSMSGVIMPISRAGVTGSVLDALWSPMDSQLAILTQMSDGHQGVFVLDSGTAEARELKVLHLQPEQGLSNLQWLPNGLGMLVVAGNSSDGEVMNGQLYVYRFDEDVPKLIATSGQGGPAGTISFAAVSPDGHSVAYAVAVRDGNNWRLHSLWVKPLKGGTAVQIPLDSNASITLLQWSAEGLVWQQEDGTVTVVDQSLQPRPLGETPQATPAASPVSSPVSEATPVG